MEHKEISQAVIGRLPRYHRFLGELKDEGVERISSHELSKKMHVTASQIRQDLNHFGGFGQQGYGYNVEHLYVEIAEILGLDIEHNLILIGAGNLGQALLNYNNFARRGFIFRGIFDHNPALHGMKIKNLEVRPMEEMSEFVVNNNIDIAVLTIPKIGAVKVAEKLVEILETADGADNFHCLYDVELPVKEKLAIIAREIYGAKDVVFQSAAEKALANIERLGYDKVPVCVAKTQYSFSDNPALLGKPEDFVITVRDLRLSAGAGFIVAYTGDIMTMPGLPKVPAAERIDILDDGEIVGLF